MTNKMRLTDFDYAAVDEGQMLIKTWEPNVGWNRPNTDKNKWVVYAFVRGLGCPTWESFPDECDIITVCDDDTYMNIYDDEIEDGKQLTEEIRRSEYESNPV